MTSLGHLVVSPNIAIERPSDHVWFHFEIYRLSEAEWGFKLCRANGDYADNVSDPDWRSKTEVVKWLEDNIGRWDISPGYGWCITDRVAPTSPRFN